MSALEVEQNTPEWHAARCGKATASKIATIMATGKSGSPSATRATYMGELAAERLTGVQAEGFTSAAMQHGSETEAEAVMAYEFERDVTAVSVGFVDHPEIKMSGASPDRLIGESGLLEGKCPNTSTHIATLRGTKIKREYILQMQWQMACTGRVWCDFISFDPRLPEPLRLHVTRVDRDNTMIKEIETAVIAFLFELDGMVKELRALETEILEAA